MNNYSSNQHEEYFQQQNSGRNRLSNHKQSNSNHMNSNQQESLHQWDYGGRNHPHRAYDNFSNNETYMTNLNSQGNHRLSNGVALSSGSGYYEDTHTRGQAIYNMKKRELPTDGEGRPGNFANFQETSNNKTAFNFEIEGFHDQDLADLFQNKQMERMEERTQNLIKRRSTSGGDVDDEDNQKGLSDRRGVGVFDDLQSQAERMLDGLFR